MAKAAAKIDDIKRPPRLAPPNSRPILVSDHSGPAADPMIASSDDAEKKEPTPPPTLSHTARTITPPSVSDDEPDGTDKHGGSPPAVIIPVAVLKKEATVGTAPVVNADGAKSDEMAEPAAKAEAPPEKTQPQAAIPEPVQPERSAGKVPAPAPVDTVADKPTNAIDELARDPEAAAKAENHAAEETKLKREVELEQVITSGKYAVPINARAQKRSRLHLLLLSLLALLLAVALVDAVLDEGLVRPPNGVPHTHFFSK